MFRGLTLTTALVVAMAEPTLSAGADDWPSLVRYAIAQGGLAAVVLVIFWSYRRDFVRLFEAKSTEAATLATLVEKNTAAMTNVTAASEAQEKATHRLARAVEKLEDRR